MQIASAGTFMTNDPAPPLFRSLLILGGARSGESGSGRSSVRRLLLGGTFVPPQNNQLRLPFTELS